MPRTLKFLLTFTLFASLFVPASPALQPAFASAPTPPPPGFIPFWSEDFDVPIDLSQYYTTGSTGSGVQTPGSFLLTQNASSQYGRIFFLSRAWTDDFSATFSLFFGNKGISAADGIAFLFCPVYDYTPSPGGALDANCPGGYIVAFDTYESGGGFSRLYLTRNNTGSNRLCQTSDLSTTYLSDNNWHNASVSVQDGNLSVSFDIAPHGDPVTLNCAIPDFQRFMGYFGFSAGTGGAFSEQRVDNIDIQASVHRSFWTEYFGGTLPSSDYYITATNGSGILNGGSFVLTQEAESQRGRIFYKRLAWMDQFDARFDLQWLINIATWGDGIAFLFCPVYGYPGELGGSLDAHCPGGYVVGFDTYEEDMGMTWWRLYVAYGTDLTRICSSSVFSRNALIDSAWHAARVTLTDGNLSVRIATPYYGSDMVLDCSLPSYAPFEGYFGFSAATGGSYNAQLVDNVRIDAKPVAPMWQENFESRLEPGEYYLNSAGSIYVGTYLLTHANTVASRLFYLKSAWMDEFTAQFKLNLGLPGGNGCAGEGVAFLICPSYDYPSVGGEGLDASCPGGYIVGFDTHESECIGKSHGKSLGESPGAGSAVVYVAANTTSNRLCQTALFSDTALADNAWHNASVSLANSSLSVSIDTPSLGHPTTLDCDLDGYAPFQGYFGFGAATTDNPTNQAVDDINIYALYPLLNIPIVLR